MFLQVSTIFGPVDKKILFLTQKLLISAQKYESGIQGPRSCILDPEKACPGSGYRGLKNHRILNTAFDTELWFPPLMYPDSATYERIP